MVTFFPFSVFRPDGGHYGREIDRAVNVLPIHGGFRSLRKKQSVATVHDGPMNGLYVHIYQQSTADQIARPDADTTPGLWLPSSGTSLFEEINEANPSDADFIYAAGAPLAEACTLRLADLVAPSGGAHALRWRRRVSGYSVVAVAITSITRVSATATVTTSAPHGLTTGDYAFHAGAGQSEYNGAFPVTVTGASTYTFSVTGTPATPATGTITWARAWWMKLELLEGATVRATHVVAGGADAEFELVSVTPTPAVGDQTNTFFRFTATVSGVPAFIRPSADGDVGAWRTYTGDAIGLFATVKESAVDDLDYMTSPALAVGATAACTLVLSDAEQLWVAKAHTVRYRYFAENAGMTLVVTFLQGTTVVATWTHAAITAAAWVTASQVLSSGEREALKALGYTGLSIKFSASYPTDVPSTQAQYARPGVDIDVGLWTTHLGGTSGLWDEVDESALSTLDYIQCLDALLMGDPDLPCTFGLSAVVDPVIHSEHKLNVWVAGVTPGVHYIRAEVLDGGTPIASEDFDIFTGGKKTLTLTAGQAAALTGYDGTLWARVTRVATGTAWTAEVDMIEFELPQPRRLRVSFVEFELPSPARADVSWAEYRTPTSETRYRGDVPTRFCGSRNNLYTFDESGFIDRSRVGAYGAPGVTPASWCIRSWGTHVVATNYVDAVQWRENNAGAFADLITGADKPKARFLCAARDHVMLGGINFPDHEPDEIWWSRFQDCRNFDRDVATQSDSRRLYDTPGQIMGMVGGDSPLIFKRRSLYGLQWVGGVIVWQRRVISYSVGTECPRSIVVGQDEVMWWAGDCFYRMRQGNDVAEPLGKGIVSRMLTDADFSDAAMRRAESPDMVTEDQRMIGDYDSRSGVFVWQYQGANDPDFRHTRQIYYSPAEDRWSIANLPGANMSGICQLPNTNTSDTAELSGIIGVDYDGLGDSVTAGRHGGSTWFRFDGSQTYEATFRTKTFAIQLDDSERPMLVQVEGVVPIFSSSRRVNGQKNSELVDVSVTLEMAMDQQLSVAYAAETYSLSDPRIDDRKVLPFRLAGVWARVELTVREMNKNILDALDGIYIIWNVRGTGGA